MSGYRRRQDKKRLYKGLGIAVGVLALGIVVIGVVLGMAETVTAARTAGKRLHTRMKLMLKKAILRHT